MSFEQIDRQDANRPEGRHCLLIYGYNTDELAGIVSFAKDMGIDDCIVVSDDQLGNKIGDIIKDQCEPTKYKTGVKPKAILMNALSNQEVHTLISDFKKLDYKKPLFAVVTPTSTHWRFGDLLKELIRERMGLSH